MDPSYTVTTALRDPSPRTAIGFIEQLPERRPERPAIESGLLGEPRLDHLTPINLNRRLLLQAQLVEVDLVLRTKRSTEHVACRNEGLSLDGDSGFLLQLTSRGESVLLVAPDPAARDGQHLSIGVADYEQPVVHAHQDRSAPHLRVKQPPVDAEANPCNAQRESMKSVHNRLSVCVSKRRDVAEAVSSSHDASAANP